ncbi:hypothetical protein ZWY2020_045578 [Hordeum vulgare]|nr:hypothetical protein ZWY2020_045578 [Hordeum vulgare]
MCNCFFPGILQTVVVRQPGREDAGGEGRDRDVGPSGGQEGGGGGRSLQGHQEPLQVHRGCIHDLAVLTKMIDALRDPAVLKTAKDAGYDEFDSRKKKCGNDCTIDMSNQERADQMVFVFAEGALHVIDDLLKRRAFFNQKKA